MDEEFENILDSLKNDGLSEDERAALRNSILSFMKANPARVPFLVRAHDYVSAGFSIAAVPFSYSNGFRARLAISALALIMVVGVGTSYAAESTLPGDLLYPIKIHVDESIEGALATTASAQADWNAELAARRLGEAEALAVEGKLTPVVEGNLSAELNQATDNFDAAVAQLANSPGNAASVADAQTNMEATLVVHTQVLDQLASAEPQSRTLLLPLLTNVQTQALAIGDERAQNNTVAAASAGASAKAAAENQKSDAEGELNQARVLVAEAASTSTPAASDTFDAEQAIGVADVKLAQGDYGAALTTFQNASLDANEAQLNVAVDNQLESETGIALSSATSTSATSSVSAAITATSTATSSTSVKIGF